MSEQVMAVMRRNRASWSSRSFLAQLTDAELQEFVGVGRPHRFSRDEVLIHEGDVDTHAMLLLSSCVKVTAALPGSAEALLAVRAGGDVVGELAATDGGPRLATVRACGREPVETVVLTGDDFNSLLRRTPRAAHWLTESLGGKLRHATRRRVDYSGLPPHVRLARVLMELADDHGLQPRGRGLVLGLDLTQAELGTLVGVSRVTAQRAFRSLREEGYIVTDGRRPVIRDPEGLRRVAGML